MADSDEWFVGEDGCLSIGKPVDSVTYHSTLNTILVATKEPAVQVLDVTSGSVLQNSDLSATKSSHIQCSYLSGRDKVLFTNGHAVGIRKDLNGSLLLDTALQTPTPRTEDVVKVELSLPDANHLFKCLMTAELPGVDYVEDVLRELEKEIEAVQQATKANHKVAKWATVTLKLPHCALKTVCSSLVMELKRLHQHVPGLPVASAISDRMTYLLSGNQNDSSSGAVERSLMYSETARRETFSKWPHMNYKWALPDAMAQAGFYHQPSSTGDDRAMCFTCNVCLVCWEPTDEPWSEHERHSPTCPFVKGEYTQNVPIAVTYATEPAQLHSAKGTGEKIECVSTGSSDDFVATSTLHGNIVVWSVCRQMKRHIQFHLDPWEPLIMMKTGSRLWQLDDLSAKKPAAKEAWTDETQQSVDTEASEIEMESDNGEQGDEMSGESTEKSEEMVEEKESESDDSKMKAAITVEVGGAWKQTKSSQMTTIQLDDAQDAKRDVLQRFRPSQDVLVSSLCVLGPPKTFSSAVDTSKVSGAAAAPPAPAVESNALPCLVSGVAIRRHTLGVSDLQILSDAAHALTDDSGEVQAMNKVNQALSGENTPQIIDESSMDSSTTTNSSSVIPEKGNPFIPYLLVHDISAMKGRSKEWPRSKTSNSDKSVQPSTSSSGTKVSSLVSTVQDFYMPQIVEMEEEGPLIPPPLPPPVQVHDFFSMKGPEAEEDPDVQILGITMPNKYKPTQVSPSGFHFGVHSAQPGFTLGVPGTKQDTSSQSSSGSSKNKDSSNSSSNRSGLGFHKEGQVVQFIELPIQVNSNQYVASLTPTLDGRHLVVVTAPRYLHRTIGITSGSVDPSVVTNPSDGSTADSHTCQTPPSSALSTTASDASLGSPSIESSLSASCQNSQGGCLLIYRVNADSDMVLLEEKPLQTCVIDNIEDAITSVLMLPKDVAASSEDEEVGRETVVESMDEDEMIEEIEGQLAITTYRGDVKILRLADCKVLAKIQSPDGDKFVSTTYCAGMDRLCACTNEGKLHFFVIGPRSLHFLDGEFFTGESSPSKNSNLSTKEDTVDFGSNADSQTKLDDLLVKQPLTNDVLAMLHDLTLFENLMPRFSATVPPCWNEIQQEQQQRRHPQHLQQQGEAMQHTRTWRLQQDSSSYDEHLFEVVLTKACSLGHIDFKFTLHPLCTTPPTIQITLLKQNISSIGRNMNQSSSSAEVDSKINFNMEPQENGPGESATNAEGPAASQGSTKSVINNVLDPQFLKRYGAEILCGPVDLTNYVDLSGHGGIITLTSPQLLKVKSRSFLIHIKALCVGKESDEKDKNKPSTSSASSSNDNKASAKPPLTKIFDPFNLGPGTDRLSSAFHKQKLENVKGCDWLQEVSVTVRRSKKSNVQRDRLQRYAMVETTSLHEQLLVTVCGQDDKLSLGTSREHRQGLALDILAWITALQMNEPTKRLDGSCMIFTVQSNLKGLVKSCFIEAGRTIAHKCAKLITLCVEYAKTTSDVNVAPAFNFALLQSLLECLSLITCAYSSGALRWFFTLLNRVKCMDITLTGQKCVDILSHVARHYHDRNNPLHSLLKARYGLYGTPLDPFLFDIDPPQISKPNSSSSSSSYAAILSSGGTAATANAASAAPVNNPMAPGVNLQQATASQHVVDEVDFKDLMSLNSSDKSSKSQLSSVQRHIYGLIEVEPLHFTCHATSDGTRMERMDINANLLTGNNNISSLSGTINFGETLSTATAAGAALASLSTAMASAEQQLQMLQQKQQQLFKLQQKLAATTKSISNSASAHSTPPSGASSYAHYNSTEFLPPPTPKTTPLFMTPPVTPPNESFYQVFGQPVKVNPGKQNNWDGPGGPINQLYTVKVGAGKASSSGGPSQSSQQKPMLQLAQAQNLLQPPPPQVLVIERMHSGARRFVVLDFGKPILLTDVIIPACSDLASLSIDVWVQGEEVDGQRLVVSTDIGIRSLVMNDLAPPPVCRYLKITTIGRYGGSTTRSRIPIGSFYGHTTILPWECDLSILGSINTSSGSSTVALEQNQIISQLSTFMALQEDIQCRYSLACNRLVSLLSTIDTPQNNSSHTRHYLRKGKKSDDDVRIQQAYQDCIQLQMQLNLAQHAMERLQKVLGIQVQITPNNNQSGMSLLKQASTDKLRVLAELLLDTLLSMTVSSPSIPQLPLTLYSSFTPLACQSLFRNLCINGTRRMQIHAGVLLVRLCGNQAWWGDFLGNILQEYFSSEEPEIFPQDRVFILLTALGQKSLSGSSANEMLESILTLLGKLLAPLLAPPQHQHTYFIHNTAQLDLSLIGWLLLFLSRNLDNTTIGPNSSDDEKPTKEKEKETGGASSRWDFLQGESAMQNSRLSAKSNSSKLYRRKLQKRLMHHKQQLLDLQQAKKNFLSSQIEKSAGSAASGLVSKEAEVMLKQQEQLFKKQLKQYSSKHFKDIMQIRRTDGEMLKKMPKDGSQGGDKEAPEGEVDSAMVVSREKCVPVVRGLMALLLSMDFTCNVDLFLIACKVVARLTNVTRPAISLSEVMSQEELEKLVLLCCNIEFNHGNISWGGAWSGHAISCLLQDILDGEKMYPVSAGAEGVTDDEMSAFSETDTSLQNSTTLPTMEEDSQATENTPAPEVSKNDEGFKFDKESSLIVDMLLEDEDCDEETNAKLQDYITGELDQVFKFKSNSNKPLFSFGNNAHKGWSSGLPINWPPLSMPPGGGNFGAPGDEKKQKFESWKNKLASYGTDKANVTPQGVSTAMDSRLEHGVELQAELKLRVMVSLETESIQGALTASMPAPVPGLAHTFPQSQPPTTDDEQLSEASILSNIGHQPLVASHEMLSMCFNNLFTQLQLQRVNLETLLLTWLTLNDETTQDENNHAVFDPSKIPSIPLNQNAVTSLIAALAWSPTIPVRTWVLAFQCLTLLSNLKCSDVVAGATGGSSGQDKWLATVMVADSNMMSVFIKFLSGTSLNGPVISSHQYTQVGPTATRAFHEFLVRLQLRCAEDNENHLKEVLLKLVYTLAAERGAFHNGLGPLDAQCKLLDHMLEQTYDCIDISNAISVIESLAVMVHQHIVSQEKVVCRSASESSVSARSCFGGLFASMLRSGDSRTMMGDSNRDVLMCSLLKLVNILVQIPLPGRGGPPRRNITSSVGAFTDIVAESGGDFVDDSSMTDASKISQSLAATSTPIITSTPNAESNAPDEEKVSETDEQKTEHSNNANKPRSCIHFSDLRNPEAENKQATLSDVVLSHPQIMRHMIQALSCCNSNTMAMILGSSGLQGSMQDSFTGTDPLSVGDGIFLILCTLNRKATDVNVILRPILEYLSSGFGDGRMSGISRLSEPLLWFILRVLDCEHTIRNYLSMGGIEVVCHNLVSSNQRVINVSPSLVSTIMQYLGNGKAAPAFSLKRTGTDTDNAEGLQNFAPLGVVTSSSPTAGPADVLIQASPPHRRARSAAWSYHFYPDEAWVDITISLPCAVLLKEIHIQPHLTSLATCPSAVSVEVSRDGTTTIPICSPVLTSGLTLIKLQLLKSEVVTAVTIRLHKPRDSATIGLSQIMLLGYTAFGETGTVRATSIFLPTEDYVSRTSIGWLRLLHHCLTQCDAVSSEVGAAAAPTPNLLVTCTALLVSHSAVLYATNIESVLLKIGLHSTDMGLSLIDHLLRNTNLSADDRRILPLHGKVNGLANESTVDILFQLGTTQDMGTASRMKALLDWMGDSARVALQRNNVEGGHYAASARLTSGDLPNPAAAHVHCMAAILWHSHELPVSYDLPGLITRDLLSSLYEWSVILPAECVLKKAIDCVICSMCYIHPQYFCNVLEWTGIMLNLHLNVALTDDHKDSTGQYQHQESMTDDSKEASGAFNRDSVPLNLQEFGHMMLDETHLSTLAVACQSAESLRQLLLSGFPAVLCQGLFEFCTREAMRHSDSLTHPEVFTDSAKNSAGSSPHSPRTASSSRTRTNSESSQSDKGLCITADMVAPVLRFLGEISREPVMKDWLGSSEGSIFWPTLLNLLCNTLTHQPSPHQLQHTNRTKVMTSQQRSSIETGTVSFFSNVISCHPENQHLFANVLCEVIRGQGPGTNSFTRRLFLQVLLEDEKILVSFRSTAQLYKGQSGVTAATIWHPRCGAGHKYRAVYISLQTPCTEVLNKVSDSIADTPSLTAQLLEERDDKGRDEKKDTSELGLEVVDQISAAAGLQAKEKRDKSKLSTPPRPPSRRGHRPPDPSMGGAVHIPVLSLYHSLLPSHTLPADMTLSQLLTLLHERGFPHGQSSIDLNMKLSAKKVNPDKKTSRTDDYIKDMESVELDTIPDEVLLDTMPFPSALQVFASVGGLALLAEHLPLLYPEVTRQVSPPPVSNDHANSNSIGNDWVTVESTDDIYEDIYEPMPPSHISQPSKQNSQVLPTIPPHSLVAFGLFLRLPGYAEVLLKERKRAQCLLRLVLGVTDDGEGGHILTSSVANALPTLPFNVLKSLFDCTPLTTDDGVLLRRMTLEIGAVHLVLACLSVLSHHAPRSPIPGFHQEAATALATNTPTGKAAAEGTDKGQSYWAKGTGFGTGSTTSSWDAEQALLRQKSEEEHVTCLLQVLSSYINPGGIVPKDFQSADYNEEQLEEEKSSLPAILPELLSQSCLVPAISSYLRNDSVLDMARHVPLYRSLLELLRGIAVCPPLVALLLPLDKEDDSNTSVSSLLEKMKTCVDTYANRLKSNKSKGTNNSSGGTKNKQEEEETEGLALLIPDIQETARIVHTTTCRIRERSAEVESEEEMESEGHVISRSNLHSREDRYMRIMKELQFDTYEMVVDEDNGVRFTVSHHYESNVKGAGDVNNASRARRLAQEAVTLSTSLPLSYSSSVFVRCDEERLDVMKVLITGPCDTPYANGCFEFDVYFPQDYPNSPPLINLETTGNHTVRFNPNLYNDGKVCLSVLNTWHGRPEEKWNSQTSSFLQVLVSIQSLILVHEPYFNEPGYERSRGTPSGTASSREYDANIRQACVKWAMLEMLRNPSACFKDAIDRHFWLKRREVTQQIEEWIAEMEVTSGDKRTGRTISHSCVALKRHYSQMKEELAKMKCPEGLEDIVEEYDEGGAAVGFKDVTVAVPSTSCNHDVTDSLKIEAKDIIVPPNGPKVMGNSIGEMNQTGSSTDDKGHSSSTDSSTSEPSTSEPEEYQTTAVKC